MAINFPASPSANDIHQVGSQIWFWNGTYWELKSNVTKFSSQDAAPSSPIAGDIWYETDTGKLFMRYDSYWVEIGHSSDGQSFQAQDAAPSSPAANDIWYESDTGKTFIYYDSYWVEIGHASDADVSAYAPLASPTLTGTPAAPTASANTSTTQLATTAFVMPEVGDYAPLASPTLTGTPAAPTAAADTNTTQIATTAYVQTELGAVSSDSIKDADNDTKIQVEEASDEDKIRFDTGGTERAVLDSSGLEIKSGGLKLDGLNSSDSNCLDDYEEGSWTVAVTCSTSGTITLDSLYDTAAYVKIGKVVHIQGYVYVSAISSPVGQLKLSLPFTTSHTSMPELSDYSQGSTTIRDAGTNIPGVTYHVTVPNETVLRIVGGGGQISHLDTIAGYVKATTSFWIGGTYRTDT